MIEYSLTGYLFAVALTLLVVGWLFFLLRSRRIREKYAVLWVGIALVIVVLGAFPSLVERLARAVGVQTPVNLLFSAALTVLLVVCIQLSVAISALEDRTRTLAEELALLHHQLDVTRHDLHSQSSSARTDGHERPDQQSNGAPPQNKG